MYSFDMYPLLLALKMRIPKENIFCRKLLADFFPHAANAAPAVALMASAFCHAPFAT